MALDNALENLIPAGKTHKIVRIGRSENSKISKAVDSLLLDSQMEAWRDVVVAKGRDFLEGFAAKNGLTHKTSAS